MKIAHKAMADRWLMKCKKWTKEGTWECLETRVVDYIPPGLTECKHHGGKEVCEWSSYLYFDEMDIYCVIYVNLQDNKWRYLPYS